MNMDMDMLAAPKKIVDGLTEVFQGFAQMFEGVSEQLELLAACAAEEEKVLLPVSTALPPDKPLPADVSAKGVTVPRPRKKPVKRQKAPDAEQKTLDAEPVSDTEQGETTPDPAEGDAQDDTAAAEETAEDNSFPVDTADDLPWEDTSQKEDTGQKEELPDKAPGADKPTEPPAATSPAQQKPCAPIFTKDDITSVIVAKIKQKRSNNEKIGQLLKAYGVGALSDLPAEKYEAFLTDISQL